MNYQNGKIYKITNSITPDIYVGSTIKKLCERMRGHRHDAKENSVNLLYEKMNLIGDEFFKIELIELFPCNSKEELTAREEYYRIALKANLNTNKCYTGIVGLTRKEYKLNHQKANAEKRNRVAREYYTTHTNEMSRKIICECGSTYRAHSRSRHEKSKKHQNFANPIIQPIVI